MVSHALIWVWNVCVNICYNSIKENTIIDEKNVKSYTCHKWTRCYCGIIIKTLQKSREN
ncbi:hypothetical protein bsdtw1_00256 [Clostridium fungisolvens]|uniref:Uncharacterized protein n=1 Tax=Clostridium fungisolvens TaxID=1604897 RepID=A0A6V8SBI0_9CLOT|nr:hypothetical protein bsdtw1_00256 [Clostridium fungisolvens]